MMNKAEIKLQDHTLHLKGDLDFTNVMPLYQQCVQAFKSPLQEITLDFSGLTTTNSVALALIVNCMRLAKRHSKALKLHNVSQEVMSLARAAGLAEIIEPCCKVSVSC